MSMIWMQKVLKIDYFATLLQPICRSLSLKMVGLILHQNTMNLKFFKKSEIFTKCQDAYRVFLKP